MTVLRGKGLWLVAGGLAVLVAGGGYVFASAGGEPAVTVSAVAPGEVVGRIVASGLVEPSRKEDVTTRVAGVLERFDLKEGQPVAKGQVIAQIARTPYEAALAEAESRLLTQESQMAQLERRTRLSDQVAASRLDAVEQKLLLARSQLADRDQAGQRALTEATHGVTRARLQLANLPASAQLKAELDHADELMRNAHADMQRLADADHPARVQVSLAEADLKAARLDIEATAVLPRDIAAARGAVAAAAQAVNKAREDLANTAVTAPFDGVVLQLYGKQGAGVNAGSPLIVLAALDTAKVAANVDEADVSRVAPGQIAQVTSPSAPSLKFAARVAAVMPRATKDSSNATIVRTEVEFRNEGGRMRDGMNADVEIEVARRADALRIPLTALQGKGTSRYVFVVDGGRVRQQAVTPGVRDVSWVEALDGLKAGDQVVTGPENVVKALRDGQAVRVRGQN